MLCSECCCVPTVFALKLYKMPPLMLQDKAVCGYLHRNLGGRNSSSCLVASPLRIEDLNQLLGLSAVRHAGHEHVGKAQISKLKMQSE